jgi:MFS family permease
MAKEPTTVEKLRGLPWSIGTNVANTVFSQFIYFGAVFVLFLDRLHLSKTEIGFILALIPFAGAIAPFVATFTSRMGVKRAFVVFYAARKVVTVALLLTPWVFFTYGERATFVFVTAVVALFSFTRAIEETAYYPWAQEFVPNSVRGKYSAMSNIFTALTGFVSVGVAGVVIDRSEGLSGFMILFAVGVLFGFVSVWASTRIPGGARPANVEQEERAWREVLRDVDFRRYLIGLALLTVGTVPLASFLPLFLQEEVGLTAGNIVLLQMGTLLGTLISSYLWGWAADRYGSKPVMLTGMAMLLLLPLLWWMIPRGAFWSLYLALGISFFQGVANLGWGIGAGRLLFVSIVPTDKKMDYLALYFAWIGIVAGASQLAGGRALDFSQGISGQFYFLRLDAYTPLFLAALVLPLVSLYLLSFIRGDSPFSTVQFAGLFLRGNPILAMGSLIRFHRARDEHNTVMITERMGEIRSPLAVDELLDALADPRFNVRFEAILAIARMPPDERLITALIQVLHGTSPALSVIAAWGLGKIGENQADAGAALRSALDARYLSVQAHSARSLGTLGDRSVIPLLLERLENERDEGLQVAYGSALGKLRVPESTLPLLGLLRKCQDNVTRMELALALARIAGDEGHFIGLFRRVRAQPGTALAQSLNDIKKLFNSHPANSPDIQLALAECADRFAQEQLNRGAVQLGEMLCWLPATLFDKNLRQVLEECASQIQRSGAARLEYPLLALHLLVVVLPGVPVIPAGEQDVRDLRIREGG